jgi:hypothetical protein
MEPRSAHGLLRDALALYRRYPLLFFILAAGVIVPYEVLVLALTGAGPLARGSLGFAVSELLALIDLAVVGALVSALHVHAVRTVSEGTEPRLGPIAMQGVRVLPVVAAATIMSWLGIVLGCLLLVIPGLILWVRWLVVAQAAAIENEGWLPALRRSHQLTTGNYRHVIAFQIYILVITLVPTVLLGLVFGNRTTTVASFGCGVLLTMITWSFGALATGLLYFDLRARLVPASSETAQSPEGRPDERATDAAGEAPPSGWDPRAYRDDDRPKGWYVDPGAPARMRFWGLGDPPGWGNTMKTPRKIRRAWRAEVGEAEVGEANLGSGAVDDDGPGEEPPSRSRREPDDDWGHFG